MSFTGVENITIPSFDATLRRLDPAGIGRDVEQARAHGFASTLLALNAGLSPDEMRQFVEIALEAADGQLEVGIEMPAASFELAHELIDFAASAGARHALVTVPPGFQPHSEDEVFDAYGALADAAQLALVLPVGQVGFPPELGGGVPWQAWGRLAQHENVGAVHVTSWMPQILFAALHVFADLELGIGNPLLLGALPLLHQQYGVSWLGPQHWELWQSPQHPHIVSYLDHVLRGEKDAALEIHWRLAPARGIAFGAGLLDLELDGMSHYGLAKYIAWSVGGNGGVTREPALHVKPHQLEARRAMLRTLGIEPPPKDDEFLLGRAGIG